jgi:hypothetical protein
LKNLKILKLFFYIFFYYRNLLGIDKNVSDVTKVCLNVCLRIDGRHEKISSFFLAKFSEKNKKNLEKNENFVFFARQKWNFRKNKKVSSDFWSFF